VTTSPPPTRRDDLVEVLHGVEVADPYRWLEDPTDPEVRAWVDAQRAVTEPVLAALPARRPFRERLGALWSVPRRGVPWRRGRTWFRTRNDGTQDQDVLWAAAATDDPSVLPPEDAWTVLLDPNAWNADGTAALTGLAVTDAGDRLAYGRSDAGSDWVTWRVVDLPDGPGSARERGDAVPWSKFTAAAWLPGGESFLYGAYDQPPAGEEVTARTTDQRVQRHRVGTEAATDAIVHARPDQPEWGFQPHVAHGDRWVVFTVWRGTDPTTRIHVAPLTGPDVDGTDEDSVEVVGEVTPLLDEGDARYDVVGVLAGADDREELVVVTDLDAPLGRVLAIDLTDPARRRELVAETSERLTGARLVGGDAAGDPAWLVVERLRHATSNLAVHDARTGAWSHDVDLPPLTSVTTVTGGRTDAGVHVGVTSFSASDEVWWHDLRTRGTTRVTPSAVPAPDVPIVTEQVLVRHRGHLDDGRGEDEVLVPRLPRPPRGRDPERRGADGPVGLRRVRHPRHPRVPAGVAGVGGRGRAARRRGAARRRRVRPRVARRRPSRQPPRRPGRRARRRRLAHR
jgi:prolyl oligopeptidase